MSKTESDEQTELDQFRTALDLRDESTDDRDEKPNWEPQSDDEPDSAKWVKCEKEHCDNWVTAEFARVFGDNEDRLVNGCPECATYREIRAHGRVGDGVGRGDSW